MPFDIREVTRRHRLADGATGTIHGSHRTECSVNLKRGRG